MFDQFTYHAVDIGKGITLLIKGKLQNMHTVVILSTTYIPRLVNIVKERPLRQIEKQVALY